MKEYLVALIAISLACSIALALSHTALRRTLRGALGVLLLVSLLSPLVTLARDVTGLSLPELDLALGEGEDAFIKITETAFEEGIAAAVGERWRGVSGVRVYSRGFDTSDMLADRITVYLSDDSVWIDYREVREYVAENFTRDGACEVIYE